MTSKSNKNWRHLDAKYPAGAKIKIWFGRNKGRVGSIVRIDENGFVEYIYDENIRCVPAVDHDFPVHCLVEKHYE
jgi:hypothetical protein